MNACMSSPSLAWWPSTDVVLSHSSPARIDTPAWPADLIPGVLRRRSSSSLYRFTVRGLS